MTRFIVPFVPYISAVQGAALRELILSGSLLIILRFRVNGLLPEGREHLMLGSPLGERTRSS